MAGGGKGWHWVVSGWQVVGTRGGRGRWGVTLMLAVQCQRSNALIRDRCLPAETVSMIEPDSHHYTLEGLKRWAWRDVGSMLGEAEDQLIGFCLGLAFYYLVFFKFISKVTDLSFNYGS